MQVQRVENTLGWAGETMREVILASGSPRRQELLQLVIDHFEVCVSDVDETLPEGIAPRDAVEMLAQRKAQTVAELRPHALVIGADTVVAVEGRILGKPRDDEQAAEMLRMLSGRTHQVYTGVAVCEKNKSNVFSCCTQLEFAPLSEAEIDWYLSTGEPFDKAGGYGIQGYGARFVKGISGDYFNVMGLPVNRLYTILGRIDK
jgi:septum formation protein